MRHKRTTTRPLLVVEDFAMKYRGLAHLQELCSKKHLYRAPDSLLKFLKTLLLCKAHESVNAMKPCRRLTRITCTLHNS